jgi:zinc transport system substrate-binding protein
LKVLDPAGAAIFQQNAEKFAQQLDNLTVRIQTRLAPVKGKAVMLSHPFFQYFFKRFGINLIASIETIPGKEPSARDITNLIKLAQSKAVKAIFDHSQLPDLAAKLVAESTGIKIYRLDPLGGVPGRKTYTELLLYNTGLLLGALK